MGGPESHRTLTAASFRSRRLQLVGDAAAAIVALLVATALSIYKPRGVTRCGWRKKREGR